MKSPSIVFLLPCLLAPLSAAAQTAPASQKYAGAYVGYTLVAPMFTPTVTLIDMDGRAVHTWQTNFSPALSTYLLDNGHLLRTGDSVGAGLGGGMGGGFGAGRRGGPAASAPGTSTPPVAARGSRPSGPGGGGRIQEIAWDGTLIWDYEFATATQVPHHDVTRMPNGNFLLLIWDGKTAEEAIAAGRNPQYQRGELPPDGIIEVKPTGKTTGQIVWEWHVWDHLIQDFDKTKPNYGDVAAHPELIDINYSEIFLGQQATTAPAAGRRAGGGMGGMGGFGGMGGGMGGGFAGGGRAPSPDWTHLNAIAYHPDRDQIIVSSYTFSECWIIDHSTTTAQAASHSGGKSGKGGDLLYRWGNPEAYRAGKDPQQTLFGPHDVHWVPPGLNGAGHVLLFNNGVERPGTDRFSSVDEYVLPVDQNGAYARQPDGTSSLPKLVWQYIAPNRTDFYSNFISGAQRLPNGNTLVCSGANGRLFEVTADGQIVWQYTVSNVGRGAGPAGPGAAGAVAIGRAGAAGRGAFGAGGMRGAGGGGFGGGTMIFRAYRFAASDPPLRDQNLPAAATNQPAP
jgi:hypothetical protein